MPEPHHEDPASGPKSTQERIPQPKEQQRHNPLLRWTTVTLPPPIFFVPLLLAAIYFLFSSSSQVQQSCSLQPVPPVQTVPYTPPSSTPKTVAMASTEQTFIAIKPDGVQRGLIGPILSRFESRGFKLVAIKLTTPGKEHLEAHYADLKGKPFFNGLIEYMNSGPICAMVWEGRDAVKTGRAILGATNPLASAPGTIRGDYAIDVGRNVCHGSDSVENAQKEIALWFKEGEAVSYKAAQFDWIYEKP
ncbi:nucleoside diphosphate kinase [Trichoderma arundinaceum]|uniref:Nucleoside diphosphate kinase n=1 Tax=Trichoderma arundinaceum TaxID=490622 RepID=A0A395NZK7_TRIAR|nr:nucleoside diphosphate kinase [Trichoderma arundinaceum]